MTATIEINQSISTATLGDGWKDKTDALLALCNLLANAYEAEFLPRYQVKTNIKIVPPRLENTTITLHGVSKPHLTIDQIQERLLMIETDVYEKFCLNPPDYLVDWED